MLKARSKNKHTHTQTKKETKKQTNKKTPQQTNKHLLIYLRCFSVTSLSELVTRIKPTTTARIMVELGYREGFPPPAHVLKADVVIPWILGSMEASFKVFVCGTTRITYDFHSVSWDQ